MSDNIAESGVSTALQVISDFGSLVSTGIKFGKVFCGRVGSTARYEYAVMGRSVSLAARLMCVATPGQIICDAEIHNRLFDTFPSVKLMSIRAKGYTEPVVIFEVISRIVEKAGGDGVESNTSLCTGENRLRTISIDTNIIIRRSQLKDCIQFLSPLSSISMKRLLIIEGQPKFGKSRLLKARVNDLRMRSSRNIVIAVSV
jgi:hypothetical protein